MTRARGIPNRATADVRAAIAAFAEGSAPQLAKWITSVAEGFGDVKPDPGKAADLYLKAIEYHIPKLARVEQRGPNEDGSHTFRVELPWLQPSIAKRNG